MFKKTSLFLRDGFPYCPILKILFPAMILSPCLALPCHNYICFFSVFCCFVIFSHILFKNLPPWLRTPDGQNPHQNQLFKAPLKRMARIECLGWAGGGKSNVCGQSGWWWCSTVVTTLSQRATVNSLCLLQVV